MNDETDVLATKTERINAMLVTPEEAYAAVQAELDAAKSAMNDYYTTSEEQYERVTRETEDNKDEGQGSDEEQGNGRENKEVKLPEAVSRSSEDIQTQVKRARARR